MFIVLIKNFQSFNFFKDFKKNKELKSFNGLKIN